MSTFKDYGRCDFSGCGAEPGRGCKQTSKTGKSAVALATPHPGRPQVLASGAMELAKSVWADDDSVAVLQLAGIQVRESNSAISTLVKLGFGDWPEIVTVSGAKDLGPDGSWSVSVNWAAIGWTDPSTARRMALVLQLAAQIAERLAAVAV